MSTATESFIGQLEAAVSPAVIGTKKAAKALAPSDIKTSQQDKLGDMRTYKRRQKKMEKGLLNQGVETDLPGLGDSKRLSKAAKRVAQLYTGAQVKEEENYALPDYPVQLDTEDDDGEWITGDPEAPIDWDFKGDPVKKANKQVKKDRTSGSHSGVEEALGELATLFQGITGQEPELEVIEVEPLVEAAPQPIVPYIDPRIIEEATNELQSLFSEISGVELFGERLEEEEVIEIPVTPLETFDISEVSAVTSQIFGGYNTSALDTTLYDPANYKHIKVVKDVDALLEKHKEELPDKEYKILKTDAAEKTADYLSSLDLDEVTDRNSMPLTGANAPLVASPMFATAVTGILRKMMATGPGTGVVELTKLDDVDPSLLSATHQFLAWDATQEKFIGAEGTTPIGDISGVTAGVGLSGGGTQGTVTLDLDVSELTAIGATAALTDYVVIQDVTDDSTKKVLVSNLFSSIGDITGVTAGTGLSGGGTSGDVTLNVEASQTQITGLGTIATGTWQGTAVANAYLGTGINANKIANGSVTSTEFQYINSLSSNAQTQITNVKTTADAAASKAFAIAQAVALG